jgi:diguanylate cyclase (GGDEF)-like protein
VGQEEAQNPLLDAARVVARGRGLDAQLGQLARHALELSEAQATAIYLLDPVARRLLPAAAAGEQADRLADTPEVALDDDALVAQAVRDRRAASGRDAVGRLGGDATARQLLALPLIAGDAVGSEEAEGALLLAYAGATADLSQGADALSAIADLAALAIRRARLEQALVEHSDWLERLASTDALTGLANRATLERMLELEIARANRQGTPLSVVLFDIDNLAALNEKAGARAGDDALRHFAALLADQVRLVDTIGRLGADEFGLIAPGSGGMIIARRIAEAAGLVELADGRPLTVSAACVVFPADGASGVELMGAGEATLAAAKQRGPGSIVAATEVSAA